MSANTDYKNPVYFDATLQPYRSLGPAGFRILMAVAILISLSIGGLFFSIGAWPIPGFLGLDVLLLYWAFRANYRAAKLVEQVRLDNDELTILRTAPNGKQKKWTMEPSWLRVELDEPADHDSQIVLRSRDRRLIIGSFLTPLERSDFANALRRALQTRSSKLVAQQFDS